ncbi:hypothetical protein [Sorangium sp. So ce1078]|uniref:hypothetical protein n=1 Tax=Sorangium sp. So ce1078 TaxID=3133329 RepID=UPI003F5E1C37
MALLDSLRDASTEGNVPLHLLLGLVSLARRLDPLVGAPGSPEPPCAPGSPEPPCAPGSLEPPCAPGSPEPPPSAAAPGGAAPGAAATGARGDALIYLLLGVISLRRTLLAELAPLREARPAEAQPPSRGAPDPAAARRGLRSLLR